MQAIELQDILFHTQYQLQFVALQTAGFVGLDPRPVISGTLLSAAANDAGRGRQNQSRSKRNACVGVEFTRRASRWVAIKRLGCGRRFSLVGYQAWAQDGSCG